MAKVGAQNAPRGERRGVGGKDDPVDLQRFRDARRVQAAGAAERRQREIARIGALFEQRQTDRVGHMGVGHFEHAVGGGLDAKAERRADVRLKRGCRAGAVERHAAAEESFCVDQAERDICVRHRGTFAAAPVTDRPRHRARALRADAKAAVFDPRDRAAAGADRPDLDHRQAHGQAVDFAFRRLANRAVADDRDIRRRAAHVDADQIGDAVPRGERRHRHRPACGP